MCPEGPSHGQWDHETHHQKEQSTSLLVALFDGNSQYCTYAFWLSEVGVSGHPALLQQIFPRRHIPGTEVNYLTHVMHMSREYKNRAFRWSKFQKDISSM
jgi:hypothetical protein